MSQKLGVAIATFASVAAALPSGASIQIIGGTKATEGEFPYMVSLSYGRGAHSCGGALLDANTILTAGHCTEDLLDDPTVNHARAGSLQWFTGGVQVDVASLHLHPDYHLIHDGIPVNDVAIWKLVTPINETDVIGYATLPEQDSDPAADTLATFIGWGYTTDIPHIGGPSLDLLEVQAPVLTREKCSSIHGSDFTDEMFCAGVDEGGKDTCNGDSGSPVLDPSGVVIGVVSWGRGCGQPNSPGVYVRVGKFVDWIKTFL